MHNLIPVLAAQQGNAQSGNGVPFAAYREAEPGKLSLCALLRKRRARPARNRTLVAAPDQPVVQVDYLLLSPAPLTARVDMKNR